MRKLSRHPNFEDKDQRKIAVLFGDHATSADFSSAATNIRFQRGQKDFFREGLIRSGRYLPEIKSIFDQYNLPEDLIYLPHVESSFNLQAYSKFGAAGIWQFTHSTGKRFMQVDYAVDQRWDPLYASEAAARLLRQNFDILGSWPLALTAYNHGAKAMSKAKKAKGNYETIFNEYEGRRFKFASRNFYSEFLAAREIAKNYTDYFPDLILSQPIKTRTYTIEGFIPVNELAEHLKLNPEEIRSLNRSLREPVFRDQKYIPKGFRLRLPDNDDLAQRMASIPADLYKPEQKRSRFYWVRKGDVASVIARRHDITLQDLIWANNLDYRARIYAGQNLRIPTPEDSLLLAAQFAAPAASEEQKAAKERLRREQLKEASVTASLGKTEETPGSANSEKALINPSIVTGNILVKREFAKKGVNFGVIQVETGETLGHFAEWLQVSAQYIRNLNHLSFRGEIHMDQNLVIPFTRIDKERFEEQRYEFHKEFEEDFLSAYDIEGVWQYKIKRGDNIWTLCKEQFELPVWLIKKYNLSVDLNKLRPGQKIVIPVVEAKTES
ncbi:MAG: LysM peptidoglycan-binding domain-containing protein [bacterium]